MKISILQKPRGRSICGRKNIFIGWKRSEYYNKRKEAILGETDADLTVLESKEGSSDITTLKAVA